MDAAATAGQVGSDPDGVVQGQIPKIELVNFNTKVNEFDFNVNH